MRNINYGAGGLVWKQTSDGKKLAVIFRIRHGNEWCLPKGKPEADEPLHLAAIREVREETGCEVSLAGYAGTIAYAGQDDEKIVIFWNMQCILEAPPSDSESVQLLWLTPEEAMRRLSHMEQKKLVSDIASVGGKGCANPDQIRTQRLKIAIADFRVELEQSLPNTWVNPDNKFYLKSAEQHLACAEKALALNCYDEGWAALSTAKRAAIKGYGAADLANAATTLRQQAQKTQGWRNKAIMALLTPDQGQTSVTHEAVYSASEILDEFYNNNYFKIALRRRSLKWMAYILMGLLITVLCASIGYQFVNTPINIAMLVWPVALFGALGAAFSVAVTLTSAPLDKDIPDQMLGTFITWMRPIIGAAAALISLVFVKAGLLDGMFRTPITNQAILAIAFISGISERFIVNIVSKKTGENKS
ncbi:MAG: NUDIX hydrolase [Mariprofundaceae bacterium]|nr:NUDIX hydrolase [Mariprofundaceae bacterium]